jgi:hypothetical protein
MTKVKNNTTPKKIIESGIIGPTNCLEGISNDAILKIAQPLINALETRGIARTDTDIHIQPLILEETLKEIRALTEKGKSVIITWLYNHTDNKRAQLMQVA